MLCPECKIEMLVDRMGPDGPVLICVNPRCPRKDMPVTKEKEQQSICKEGA